jgi:hypothetical protein
LLCVLSAGALLAPAAAYAQTCGFPAGGTLTGIVNTYYPGVGTAAVNATSITVDRSAIRGSATPIAAGDMLLVMQMQDASINSTNNANYGSNSGTGSGVTALNNTGLFEYVVATSGDPGAGVNVAISIVGASATNGLINSYTTAASTGAAGQKTFQVVRVPRYGSATLSGGLTAVAWDGQTGGILAVDVSGTLTLGGTVSVDGLGFRGAPGESWPGDVGLNTDYIQPVGTNADGVKGEGIAGTPSTLTGVPGGAGDGYPNGDRARGAPGTAGGGGTDGNPAANDQNTGGGGGANGGNGGRGGSAWPGSNTCPPVQGAQSGGIGGTAMAPASTRLIRGGGGGAGTANNNGPSGGGNGGGIVLMRAGAVAGTGTITARGIRPPSTANDGGGGGGAGGTIVLLAATGTMPGLTVNASGGGGGYANLPSPPAPDPPPAGVGGVHHGPGGGGGGGVILLSSAPASSSVAGGPSGLTNTCAGDTVAIPYDAQAGTIGVVQTNLTLGSLPGVQVCTVATRASIRGLRVNPAGTVEFTTGSQRGTLAFNVYATEDPSGKGKLSRLNRQPVPAPVPSSVHPILYRVDTAPITAPYLMIEEIEVGGHRRMLGPFPVADATLESAFERVEARVKDEEVQERRGARVLSGRSLDAERPRGISGGEQRSAVASGEGRLLAGIGRSGRSSGVKIEVKQAGIVRVPFADLVAHGIPGALAAAPGALRLTNLGRPIEFHLVPDASGMPSMVFEAETLSTDYTGSNVYVVTGAAGAPPSPGVPLTRSGFPLPRGMVRVEKNVLYAPFVPPGADPWIWDLLVAGQPAGPYAFDAPSPSPRWGTSVHVRVGVGGGSDHVHTVSASINGFAVGQVTFTGKVPAVVEGTLPGGAVHQTGNELQIAYTARVSSPNEVGLLFLDVVDLSALPAPPQAPAPVSRLGRFDSEWPEGRGDYLILTHALFLDHAHRIAALKQAEGFRPWVVDVERAYDRYSAGVFEARAIQAFIRDAFKRRGVRYVLLIGGDSYDPRDFSGMGNVSFLPSLDAWDGQFGRVPSENKYADVDGDGLPDVAIGRLPVTTLEEAETLVDKIARQADVVRSAGPTHLFAVGSRGRDDISFLGEAEKALGLLPAGSQASLADVGQGIVPARSALLSGLSSGPLATHYFGHGGFDIWADEGLLTLADVKALPATRRETILFTWTCETQWYRLHDTINQTLLLHPQGGALAALGPAGITDPTLQVSVYPRVYQYFFAGYTLGEAVRRAKADALAANPATRPAVEGWNLLGDPALRLDSGTNPR